MLPLDTRLSEAMRHMRAGDLAAATRAIQQGIGGLSPFPSGEDRGEGPSVPGSPSSERPVGDGGSFTAHHYRDAHGIRPYKLFRPKCDGIEPRPLLLLLHGCTQAVDDFAMGTRMNHVAAERGCYVAYPQQVQGANTSRCWNWFRPGDQGRDGGEPALLAGLVRELVASENIDPARVFVAGMSAGGAMAVTLAATHPELFAAVGVHSGLPHGAAHDVPSALAAMRAAGPRRLYPGPAVPAIVFHGDADRTVDPCNGANIAFASAGNTSGESRTGAANGRAYTCTRFRGPGGEVAVEHWVVHGAGHAWSGGDARGSHTDALGPDASREMLRFFLER
jgi:poly(hydroxyalkanoate) depolymerase family esterase